MLHTEYANIPPQKYKCGGESYLEYEVGRFDTFWGECDKFKCVFVKDLVTQLVSTSWYFSQKYS